jgi:hypothetical protein
MTAAQITKRLVKNQIELTSLTIERDEIEVAVDYKEINGYGTVNEAQTKKLANKIKKLFPECSHVSRRQYGAIALKFNFTKCKLVAQNID